MKAIDLIFDKLNVKVIAGDDLHPRAVSTQNAFQDTDYQGLLPIGKVGLREEGQMRVRARERTCVRSCLRRRPLAYHSKTPHGHR